MSAMLWVSSSNFGDSSPKNDKRDRWFENPNNKVFYITIDEYDRITFTSAATGDRWVTTPAKLVGGNPDIGYADYLTSSGTHYRVVWAAVQPNNEYVN